MLTVKLNTVSILCALLQWKRGDSHEWGVAFSRLCFFVCLFFFCACRCFVYPIRHKACRCCCKGSHNIQAVCLSPRALWFLQQVEYVVSQVMYNLPFWGLNMTFVYDLLILFR